MSNASVQKLLDKVGVQFQMTKTGKAKISSDALEAYNHPVCDQLLEIKKKLKLITTFFGKNFESLVKNSRIHPSFKICGTVTHRLSCESPNLQNLPRGKVRNIIQATPGFLLMEGDYQQAELRALAFYTKDSQLKKFLEEEDPIRMIAQKIFNKKSITKDERSLAKFVVYGVMYGRSVSSIASSMKSYDKAKSLVDSLHVVFPKLKIYKEKVISEARLNRKLTNIFGVTRHFPLLKFDSFHEREALNFLPQSTVACMCLDAMSRVLQRFRAQGVDAYLLCNLHDALLFEVREEQVPVAKQILQEEMQKEVNGFKMPVKISVGRKWGDL